MRRGRLEAIQPGRQFRPAVASMMVSTARVLTIGPDAYGIPHVRFEITLTSQSGHTVGHERRVLSLETFAALYSEPVAEPAPERVAV